MSAILELPHGLHYDVPEAIYHERTLGIFSQHTGLVFEHSAASYRYSIDAPEDDAPERETFVVGRALHCAVLEPERFARDFVRAPKFADGRSAEGKAQRAAFAADHPGATVLTEKQWADVTGMAASVRRQSRVAALLAAPGTRTEVTVRWAEETATDDEPDLPAIECKARVDVDCPAFVTLLDVKSTQNATADEFSRDIEKWGYHEQAALYLRAYRAIGEERDVFAFPVVEKSPPYLCAVYGLDEGDLLAGDLAVRMRLRRFARCIATDTWPGLPAEIQTISRPAWARRKST